MNGFEPEQFQRKKRLIIVAQVILLIIQLVTLWAYYFKEKQTILTPPLILGIMINIYTLINTISLGK